VSRPTARPCQPGPALALAAVLALGAACAAPRAGAGAPQRFVFQNGFWNNLHHFLRAEARRATRQAELELPLAELAADERDAWSASLAAYQPLAQRSLLFDPELLAIRRELARASEALPPGRLPPAITRALSAAAPIYRARLWTTHADANEDWIAAIRPEAERLGEALVHALAEAYRLRWPDRPILVEPSWDCGPNLAYSTDTAPPDFAGHVTVASRSALGGPVAFECLAHEASHVVDGVLVRWIEDESRRQGVAPPEELWHALLFFTSGVVAERIFGAEGTYRRDVAEAYPAFHAALEQHWRPYLERDASFERALEGLVADSAVASRPRAP
jgi:hypothetical protein